MKNIYILPTDNPSRLSFDFDEDKYLLTDYLILFDNQNLLENRNIYITSDDEIKVGDWYINTFVSERDQKPQTHTEKSQLINHKKDYRFNYCKKIILTTDQNLIKNGIQSIPDEFLEWLVENPTCESVELKPWFNEILSCCKSESECSCNKKRIVLPNNN